MAALRPATRVAREVRFLEKIDDRRAKPLSRPDRRSFSLAAPALSETSHFSSGACTSAEKSRYLLCRVAQPAEDAKRDQTQRNAPVVGSARLRR